MRATAMLDVFSRAAACTVLLAVPAVAAEGTWGTRAALPAAHSEFAIAELDGAIYVIGGYAIGEIEGTSVHIYDAASDRWRRGPPLPAPAHHLMAASAGGKIYAMGGQGSGLFGGGFIDSVWALDPASGQWAARAPMPTARSAGVAVALDGRIYVAGGRPPHGHDFAAYDPAADAWTVLPDMPRQRNHLAGAAIGGRIFIAGGRLGPGYRSEASAALEVFDPAAGTWSAAAPMPRPRSGVNGVAARGCFHVWGGEGGQGMFPDHTVYDPRTDHWIRLADMPVPVHGVTGAAFVDGLIHIPGGGQGVGGRNPGTLHQTYRPGMACE
ncbi:MAG: kelch-like protein [Alphaproteobacteria bacterium]|nr:kelch-like protein [Alphaproteobacteria bacterium]